MSRLKKLIHEIHRRSLWQVLGIYVVGSWFVLQIVDTMVGALKLPDWAPPLALILLIVGLPIVLATAFIQEGMSSETADQAGTEAGESSVPASPSRRLFTWRNAALVGVGAFALIGVATAGWLLFGPASREEIAADAHDRRSVAVLPLANMSPDPENEFFTDGIHEEIIAQLAKISALKVISRTSVEQYRNKEKSTPTIAGELGVANVLEGSVRRAGDQVRITVQLIEAATEDHLWAETYEEELTTDNLFAIQSDVAQEITRALRAELLPQELARIETVPTNSRAAYDLYLQGNLLVMRTFEEDLWQGEQLYGRAVALDPEFAHAWANLSQVHSALFHYGFDRTEERLRRAKEAVDRALQLDPELAEAHRALGWYHYWGYRDYAQASAAFERAEQGLPGDINLLFGQGAIAKRQGKFDEALAIHARASELAPRDDIPFGESAIVYEFQRRYAEAEQHYDRALAVRPNDPYWVIRKAQIPLVRDGETGPLRAALSVYPRGFDPSGVVTEAMWRIEIFDRRYDAALAVLDETDREWWETQEYYEPKALREGLTHRFAGNSEAARAAFEAARSVLERLTRERPRDPRLYRSLGLAAAGLGLANEAIQHGLQAQELLPRTHDAISGSFYLLASAWIYGMAGQPEPAIRQIDLYLAGPGQYSLRGLLADPRMDLLREHPAFEKLAEKWGPL